MLLRVVGRSCAKLETGQTSSYVQADAALLANNVASVCTGLNAAELIGRGRGGESSLLPIGVTSLCGRWICTTLPPEVRS